MFQINIIVRIEQPHEIFIKVSKGAKIRNRYNQVPHVTQDTNGKLTNSQLYTTNESQKVSPKSHFLRVKKKEVRGCI